MNLGTIQNTNKTPVRRTKLESSKKNWFKAHKILTAFLIFLVLFGSVGGAYYYKKIQDYKKTGVEGVDIFTPIKTVINSLEAPDTDAIKKLNQTNGRTNFLLLGVDARGTAESLNTDTIMVVSYDHAKNQFGQISFPRDLQVKYRVGNTNYDLKINSVFPTTVKFHSKNGQITDEGIKEGFKNLGTELTEISGLDVHYGVMINFQGFKEIVDALGGVTVNVERSFHDCGYPNEDNLTANQILAIKKNYVCSDKYKRDTKTMLITYNEGTQQMDGSSALKYARSRHSDNPKEGTDFARARRQQIVINAIKDKFTSSSIFSKVDSLNQLITTLSNNIKFYNIKQDEIDAMIKSRDLLKTVKSYSLVLSNQIGNYPGHLLNDPPPLWQLKPVTRNDYEDVKKYTQFFMNNEFLLMEDPRTDIAWTNAKRQGDYNVTKQLFRNNYMKFTSHDPFVKVTPKPTVTPSGTTTPSATPIPDSEKPYGTIYTLTDKAPKSLEFYMKLFKDEGLKFVTKPGTEFPTELEKFRPDTDLFIVIE